MTLLVFSGLLLITQLLVGVVKAGWIDIDTPVDQRTTISKIDGTIYQLVRCVGI